MSRCSGHWSLGPNLCYINSFVTMVIWMEHMLMFAILKVDKMLFSLLPAGDTLHRVQGVYDDCAGKYPLLSLAWTRVVVMLTWVASTAVSFCINTFCEGKHSYYLSIHEMK